MANCPKWLQHGKNWFMVCLALCVLGLIFILLINDTSINIMQRTVSAHSRNIGRYSKDKILPILSNMLRGTKTEAELGDMERTSVNGSFFRSNLDDIQDQDYSQAPELPMAKMLIEEKKYRHDDQFEKYIKCPTSVRKKMLDNPKIRSKFIPDIPILMWDKHFNASEYRRLTQYKGINGWRNINYTDVRSMVGQLNSPNNQYMFDDRLRKVKGQSSDCTTCAIIGNGGILKGSGKGAEIDAHDYVFRVNAAVTKGFENDVGKKTSFYCFTMVTLHNTLALRHRTGFEIPKGDENLRYLFFADSDWTYTFLSAALSGKPLPKSTGKYHRGPPAFPKPLTADNIKVLHPDFERYIKLNDPGEPGGQSLLQSDRRQLRMRSRIRHQRRLHLLNIYRRITFILAMNADALTQHRHVARLERPGLWWINASTNFSPQQWKENFRMSRETFFIIVDALRGEIEKMNTGLGCHSVEKRVAITIWRLATPNAYRCISQLFGVGKATAWGITHEVCRAIVRTLLPRYIRFPEGEDLQRAKRGFAAMGMPQAVGAIDGTHIQIKAPKDCPHDYFNRKGFYSVIMQAVVDHKCRFTDIYIGWPGCVHDARVLSNSELYRKGENGILLPPERQLMNGVEVPLFIIGDAAYPLRTWLMKGYPETGRLTPRQVRFNHQLSRVRMVVERAFGLLKARWRSLSRINESKIENMTHLIAASCVLHNICQDSDVDMEVVIQHEHIVPHPGLDAGPTPLQCRDALAEFLDQ